MSRVDLLKERSWERRELRGQEKQRKNKGDAAHCFRIWGRPLERSVCSRLKRAADWEIHDSLPYGLRFFTQRRMASTSDSVSGLFT
jgi:hypothetical protein